MENSVFKLKRSDQKFHHDPTIASVDLDHISYGSLLDSRSFFVDRGDLEPRDYLDLLT